MALASAITRSTYGLASAPTDAHLINRHGRSPTRSRRAGPGPRDDVAACQSGGDVKYYAVAELEVTDQAWVRDYIAQITPVVERWGGRAKNEFPLVADEDIDGLARIEP